MEAALWQRPSRATEIAFPWSRSSQERIPDITFPLPSWKWAKQAANAIRSKKDRGPRGRRAQGRAHTLPRRGRPSCRYVRTSPKENLPVVIAFFFFLNLPRQSRCANRQNSV